jgi:TetR/AcrR family transcriptional regulator, transcriptional repressor for nem operon
MTIKPGPSGRTRPKRPKRSGVTSTRRRGLGFGEARPRRLQQRAEAKRLTRETLVHAGLEEIIDHGVDVGLDAICARAGYTRGAFYVHFKNREEFLLAIAENVLQAILDAGVSAGAEGGVASSIERFARALEANVWPLLPKIGVATVRMVDAIDRWPTIRLTFDRFLTIAIERLTHIAEREQAAGRIRSDVGARDLATLLVTMAMGTIMMMNTGVRMERGKRRTLLLEMIRPPEAVTNA